MNLSNIHAIRSLPKVRLSAGIVYWLILLSALIAFEFFNYSTTEFALRDLMGDLKFMGMHWATILALAFCGIVTNGGVASTVRDAHVRDFHAVVLSDGCAAFTPAIHDAAIAGLRPVAEVWTVASATMQREVADRLCAAPGSKDYGVLTVAAGFFSAPQRLFNVSPSCFYPRPEVESAVVQMEIAPHPDADFDAFMNTVKTLFAMRRKTVKSNLRTAGLKPEQADGVLKAAGIEENARAETLGVNDFIAISRELKKIY